MKKLGYMLALSLFLAGCVNDGELDDTAKITKPLSEKEAIQTQEEEAIQDSMDEERHEAESDKNNETSTDSGISESSEKPAAEVKSKGSEQAPSVKEPAQKNEKITSEVKKEAAPVKSERSKYLNKLANVKASISEFDKQLEGGTMEEMGQAYGEIFKRWDQEMKDINGALKNQLSVSEMNKLRAEQRNWLIYRDKTAKEASVKYEGGTMASLEYVATQARLTEERSYELVEAYMY